MTLHIGIAGPIASCDVAHLLDHPERMPGLMQGASLLVTLIEELLARGCRVSAFTMDGSLDVRPDNVVCGIGGRFTLYCVPVRRRSIRFEGGLRGRILDLYALERAALASAMRRAAPDLVHAHWQYEYGWAALESGLPHIVTCHDSPWLILRMMPNAYRLGRLLMARHVLARAHAVTAVSPYLVEAVQRMCRAGVELVPNPMPNPPTSTVRTPRTAPGPGRPARVAMIVNGWGKRKNAHLGLIAMHRLQRLRPGTECHLIGPDFGPSERAATWAGERGIEAGFQFHGRMPYERVQSLLGGMDLLIHPALEESFGMTIAEAMSFGIPVVAGQGSGAVPWVTGGGAAGRLVDVRSEAAIADAALVLLNSPDVYRRCSAAGLQRARSQFSASGVVDGYTALYLRALAAPPLRLQRATTGGLRKCRR